MAYKLPDGRIVDDFGQISDAKDYLPMTKEDTEVWVYGETASGSDANNKAGNDNGDRSRSGIGKGEASDLFVNIGLGILAIMIIVMAFYFGFNT